MFFLSHYESVRGVKEFGGFSKNYLQEQITYEILICLSFLIEKDDDFKFSKKGIENKCEG